MLPKEHLIPGKNCFKQNQSYDYSFQPQRTFRIDDVCQGLPRIGDNGELASQKICTLL
jgi:hypothetical protein